jgi:hypothetical protein
MDLAFSNLIKKMKINPKIDNPFENSVVYKNQVFDHKLPKFSLENLILISLVCFYISSKLDDMYPLNKKDVLILNRNKCSEEKLFRFEYLVLELIGYNIGFPLPTDCIELLVSKYFISLGKEYKKNLLMYSNLLCRFSLFFYSFSLLKSDQLALLCILGSTQLFQILVQEEKIKICKKTCSEEKNKNESMYHHSKCVLKNYIKNEQLMINHFLEQNDKIIKKFDLIQKLIELKKLFKDRKNQIGEKSYFFKIYSRIDFDKVMI